MIEIRYLQAESGANRFGTCNCCGKSSGEDPLMISVKFSYYGHGTLICLCDDCKKKLMEVLNGEKLPPANNSETPNSSDTISRAKAIEAINKALDRQTLLNRFVRKVAIDAIKQLPPAQPEIIRCKDCKYLQCNMRLDGYLPKGVDEFECRHWCGSCDPMDFCSYAERREVTT